MDLGSPTAVTVLNDGTGFDGYDPGPNVVFRVIGFTRSVRLNASTNPSTRAPPESRNERLTRRLTVKKLLPLPAFLGIMCTCRTAKFGVDIDPAANGRPAVVCRLLTSDTMLKAATSSN